jgi:hypothetical protein
MQIQDDDFPYVSDDPSLTPVKEENELLSLTSQQLGDLKATLRLGVGSALVGSDTYIQRLRRMQAAQESIKPETLIIDENETARQQLRYLLLGILFETPDLLQSGLAKAGRASDRVLGLFSKILSPFTNSWVFRPVKNRYDNASARGESVIDRLIMRGRIEEQNSRLIVQQEAIDDVVNDLLEYVILKTDVQKIIQESGTSMAGNAIDEFRDQSAAVDSMLEQKLKSIFKKNASSQPVTPTNNLEDGR